MHAHHLFNSLSRVKGSVQHRQAVKSRLHNVIHTLHHIVTVVALFYANRKEHYTTLYD